MEIEMLGVSCYQHYQIRKDLHLYVLITAYS